MTSPKGVPVNAVYGTLSMLIKLLSNYEPSHVILARDVRGGSFRNEKYPQYKANRGEPPEDLVPQFGLIEDMINAMNIPHKGISNYEADDVIGSLCVQFKSDFDEILIASSDKDLMQFIDGNIKMLDTMKDITYAKEEVFTKMGVWPEQIVDYLSLLGDASDNIPGVKGIGAKGAAKLLLEYGSLDNILKNVGTLSNKRANTALEKYGQDAHLSKELVTIVTDLDLGYTVDELAYTLEGNENFLNFLDELNFKALRAKVSAGTGGSSANDTAVGFDVIKDEAKFNKIIAEIEGHDQIYIEPFFSHNDYHKLDPEVFGIAVAEKNYIFYSSDFDFVDTVAKLIKIEDLTLITTNSKVLYFCAYARSIGTKFSVFDITQAHFVLNPERKHTLEMIASELLTENVLSLKELRKENFEDISSQKNFEFGFAKRIYSGMRVYPWLAKQLKEAEHSEIYEELDLPLLPILSKMEWEGVSLDTDIYSKLEVEFSKITDDINAQVKEMTGEDVNLKSPKQVGALLFDKLGLPVIKKTKTGYSTNAAVLEELAKMGESDVPALIMKYREIEKLNSTYVKALPELVHEDGKIHTHFNQAVAATGRLSSENPNLQNIPIRTENGRRLRSGFKASPGNVLLGADYSQVELRLLAHFSGDKVMLDAFKNDEDIHAQTAAEIFGLELSKVTKEERSYAKAINFGLMYGQSSFGLSQMLGISPKEAKDYIIKYFNRFSSVKGYLDTLKERCERTGYSETMHGRRRYIADINSSNRMMKSAAERMAINSPIQGTAADIIKKAMLKVDSAIRDAGLNSKMILQVHDELIFEVPTTEISQMEKIVRDCMESAVELKIPLKVDMGSAANWYDLK